MIKIELTEESISNMSSFEKDVAFDWYRNLSTSQQNEMMDKYVIGTPLSNGCVLKIYQAEAE